MNCPKCNTKMIAKPDVSKKTGKPWSGNKCPNPVCNLMIFDKVYQPNGPKPVFHNSSDEQAQKVQEPSGVNVMEVVFAIDRLTKQVKELTDKLGNKGSEVAAEYKSIVDMFQDREPGQEG